MKYFFSVFIILNLLSLPTLRAQLVIPEGGKAVLDQAELLSPAQEDSLGKHLHSFFDSEKVQMAILTVPVAYKAGLSIEEYSLKVAEKWALGEEKRDNGVLILLVGDTSDTSGRGLRIEVGYGLEAQISDVECGRIIQEMIPFMKEEKYYQALSQALSLLMVEAKESSDPVSYEASSQREEENTENSPVVLSLIQIVSLVLIIPGLLLLLWPFMKPYIYGQRKRRKKSYPIRFVIGLHLLGWGILLFLPFYIPWWGILLYWGLHILVLKVYHQTLSAKAKSSSESVIGFLSLLGLIVLMFVQMMNVLSFEDEKGMFLIMTFNLIFPFIQFFLFIKPGGGSGSYSSSGTPSHSSKSSISSNSSSSFGADSSSFSGGSSSGSSDYSGGGGSFGGGGASGEW